MFTLSCLGVTTTIQIYIYGPIQAHIYGNFTDQQIIVSNIISLIVMLFLFPFVGKLTDRVSRTKIVIASSMGFLTLTLPFFYTLSYGSYQQLILMQSLISLPATAYYATVPVMLAEMFPLRLRCTVLSFLYSIAASLSAGLTPLLSYVLLNQTQISTSPSLLVIGLVFFSMLTMWLKYLKSDKDRLQLYA